MKQPSLYGVSSGPVINARQQVTLLSSARTKIEEQALSGSSCCRPAISRASRDCEGHTVWGSGGVFKEHTVWKSVGDYKKS